VTAPGVAAAVRDDLSWLPDAERIVMVFAETGHGRCVVYDDGHMIEMAALDEDELHVLSVNDHRVLLDRGGIAAQIATLADHTATRVSTADPSGSRRRDMIVKELIIGLGRFARGEHLSAHERIRANAITPLVSLIRDLVPTDHHDLSDNLDPYRRLEQTHPALAKRLSLALTRDIPELATEIVNILRGQLTPRANANDALINTLVDAVNRAKHACPTGPASHGPRQR
jgi:hypothetical protein